MRKFLSITFLAILVLNLFGFYLAFLMNRQDVRKEKQQTISDSAKEDATVLSMSKEEFEHIVWIEDKKEFRMNGRLFDVEEIEVAENHVNLYVEEDVKETEVVDDFTSTVSQQQKNEHNRAPLKALLQHFLKEFTWSKAEIVQVPAIALCSYSPSANFIYTSINTERQTPPPDGPFS